MTPKHLRMRLFDGGKIRREVTRNGREQMRKTLEWIREHRMLTEYDHNDFFAVLPCFENRSEEHQLYRVPPDRDDDEDDEKAAGGPLRWVEGKPPNPHHPCLPWQTRAGQG